MARLFVADDKFPDVIAQLQARGWTRFAHDAFPNFALRWTNYAKIAWPRVRAHQIVNHFHGAVVLSRKDDLAARLYRSSSSSSVDAFYPRTLDLSKNRAKETLAAWFLYARAVGVAMAAVAAGVDPVGPRPSTKEIQAAVAYLQRVLQLDAFFASWSDGAMDYASLELENDQWETLRRKPRKRDDAADQDTLPTAIQEQLGILLARLRELDIQLGGIAAGHGDVWICKPSNLSQGRGIHLLTDLDALLRLATPQSTVMDTNAHPEEAQALTSATQSRTPTTWVVQKYVERPLLLQRHQGAAHKFDVRQWVLITALDPLTVYWYKDCYLRFCSHAFTLASDALGDSFTHLSNYSIQKDATVSTESENGFESMWLSDRFQDQLRREHGRDVWSEIIMPQMQHGALAAIRAALPELRSIGRGFEWLGIDFLLDTDFRVWLLEVNVSPDVSHSTDVTAKLVPPATCGVLDCAYSLVFWAQ